MATTKSKLVMVEWVDIAHLNGWNSRDDERIRPARCISVGRLLKNTKTFLTVAGSWGTEDLLDRDDVHTPLSIPKGCVRSVVEIKWPRKRVSKKIPRKVSR